MYTILNIRVAYTDESISAEPIVSISHEFVWFLCISKTTKSNPKKNQRKRYRLLLCFGCVLKIFFSEKETRFISHSFNSMRASSVQSTHLVVLLAKHQPITSSSFLRFQPNDFFRFFSSSFGLFLINLKKKKRL